MAEPNTPTKTVDRPIAAGAEASAAMAKTGMQTVLVLQGGGALGAYQAGVYQALDEAGIKPDWVIGTSIGAINAALIAGSPVEARLDRLNAFWRRVQQAPAIADAARLPGFGVLPTLATLLSGIPGFFRPNPIAFFGPQVPLGAEAAGYYSTRPLAETLGELVDFAQVNAGGTRLTVGAASVDNGVMRYFDSRDMEICLAHVMASGALPPAFPAVRIDGQLYWDGGILSNTPVEAVFDDAPRRNSLIFAVHLWNPDGPEPETIREVMNRQKDLQYASRTVSQIERHRQIHRLRHIVAELAGRLPERDRTDPKVRAMAAHGCLTRMHVVQLLAPMLTGEDHTKDIDFSPSGIEKRWAAGYAHGRRALERKPWEADVDPLEGFVLHKIPGAAATM